MPLKPLVHLVFVIPVHIALLHERESDTVLELAELLNLGIGPRLLPYENKFRELRVPPLVEGSVANLQTDWRGSLESGRLWGSRSCRLEIVRCN